MSLAAAAGFWARRIEAAARHYIAVWAALDPDALPDAERVQMATSEASLVFSAVAVWELRLKWHSLQVSGARKGLIHPGTVVAFATAVGWEFLSLAVRRAAAGLSCSHDHEDPFDELLLVQAQEENMRLLTRDTKFVGHLFAATGKRAILSRNRSL